MSVTAGKAQLNFAEMPDGLYVLTCAPGEALYAAYGHSAVLHLDRQSSNGARAAVYNYGVFDSFEENFALKFMRGTLLYQLDKEGLSSFLEMYSYFDRGVVAQHLSLSRQEVADVVAFLEENYKPENRKYRYHFFFDNCSTRVLDALEQSFGNRLQVTVPDSAGRRTFRDHIHTYQAPFGWTNFGIDLLLGMPADAPATPHDETFLPDFLKVYFDHTTLDGRPLVDGEFTLLQHTLVVEPISPSPVLVCWIIGLAITCALVVGRLLGRNLRGIRALLWLLFGLLGVLLVFMWAGTDHDTTVRNLNLLFLSPLYLVLLLIKAPKTKGWFLALQAALTLVFLVGWGFLPQQFHPATIPLAIAGVSSCLTSAAFPGILRPVSSAER